MLAHAPLEPNQKWVDMMKEALDGQPGGPAVYLTKLFPSDVEKTSFSKWLFPERSDICYHHKSEIPHVQEQQMAQTPPLALHIAAFGWEDGCGVKPPPGRDLALQLMDWFCKDGFVTSGEPILIAQPLGLQTSVLEAPWQGSDDTSADQCLKPFTVGYIKGRARMTSILALLGLIYSHEESFDFRSQWPQLYDSLSVIWVHHLRQSTKEDEVLCNMKLSMRGSLRKACNVVQMASMIKRLMAEGGTDYPSFVRRFNSQTVQSHQIRGRKAAALKLLFESAPKDCFLLRTDFGERFKPTKPALGSCKRNKNEQTKRGGGSSYLCRTSWTQSSRTSTIWAGLTPRGQRRTCPQNGCSLATSSQPKPRNGCVVCGSLMIL